MQRIHAGDVVILDGGVSTEIERRGVKLNKDTWSGTVHLEFPDVVREVHADYIRAGAQVITANTFAAARHVLERVGLGAEVEAINRDAVRLAREGRDAAAEGPVWIAGSISSMYVPLGEAAAASYREQADILADAGVDLILTEMLLDYENAALQVEAAKATGLPVWLGYSAEIDPHTGALMCWREKFVPELGPEPFEDMMRRVLALDADGAGIMHSYVEAIDAGLEALARHWSKPMLAYAETGYIEPPDWQFVNIISPQDYAAKTLEWVARGVQLIGGCCGTGPEHIAALKQRLPAHI